MPLLLDSVYHGRPQGGDKTGISSPLEIGNAKISEKHKISSLIPISWVNYCSDSLFANMTLTLQKSQFTVLV